MAFIKLGARHGINFHRQTLYRWNKPCSKGGSGGILPSGAMHKILVLSRLEGVYLSPKDLDPVPREVMRYKFVPTPAPKGVMEAPNAPESPTTAPKGVIEAPEALVGSYEAATCPDSGLMSPEVLPNPCPEKDPPQNES